MGAPNIRLRGLRSPNIPPGYILGRGRVSGTGEVELLNLQQLQAMGVASSGQVAAATALNHGFGFNVTGLMTAGQLIGTAIYGFDITFFDVSAGDVFSCLIAPTGAASMPLIARAGGGASIQVGAINFNAGSKTGALAWGVNPFLLAKGTSLSLLAPLSADASFSGVSGLCYGTKS